MGPAKSGAAELSAEEEAATAKFLENVNKWREARQMGEVSLEDYMGYMYICQDRVSELLLTSAFCLS